MVTHAIYTHLSIEYMHIISYIAIAKSHLQVELAISMILIIIIGHVTSNDTYADCTLKTEPLAKLKGKYIRTFAKIKQTIKSKQLEIDDLRMNLEMAGDFSTNDITTTDQLFSLIGKNCTIYDYESLQVFLESLDCNEALNLLEEFTKELNNSILKELDLMSEINKPAMKGIYTLKVKYTGKESCKLSTEKMVRRIVMESLELKRASIFLIGAAEGCITFIYQISAVVKSYILDHKRVTPKGLALLASCDIKCLIVDETEILVPLEFKTQVSYSIHFIYLCKSLSYLRTKETVVLKI